MSPLKEPTSPAAVPAPQTDPPPTAENNDDNRSAFGAVNLYLDLWIVAINGDQTLSAEAPVVAKVMARSVGIGRTVFTDWQRVNTSLGRHPKDCGVLESIRELQSAGYLGRSEEDKYFRPNWWSLLSPEGEL